MVEETKEEFIKIDGGLGRCIALTGAINKYAKSVEHKVNVVSSFPQVFNGLEELNRVYSIGMPYLYEDYISKGSFSEPEPYNHSNYYSDLEHISSVFSKIVSGVSGFVQPEMSLTENELEEAKSFIDDMKKQEKKKVLLVQPWGSTGGIQIANDKGEPKVKVDETYRSLGLGFFRKLITEFEKDYVVISIQSTAHFEGKTVPQVAIKGTKVLNLPDVRKLIALIPFVDGIIACDSFLHHASAALQSPTPTVVLWGATSKKNLGYKEHLNLVARENVLIEPNRIPHDHAFYVNKNKGVNEFDLKFIKEIRHNMESDEHGIKTSKNKA